MLTGMGSIDAMLADPDALAQLSFRGAKTMPDKLREHCDILKLSRELATIKLDVALDFTPDQLAIKPADQEQLVACIKGMNLNAG